MATMRAYITTTRDYLILPLFLALFILFLCLIHPLGAVTFGLGICFLLAYFYRREWVLAAVFVGLLFQNLAYHHVRYTHETLAFLVKNVDDALLIFFVLGLTIEAVFPRFRTDRVPLWKNFVALVILCLVSAVYNHLPHKFTAIGTYILLKNFVWFYLAASISFRESDYRKIFRFLVVILGGVMAFGFFQLATGSLTYDILGLPKDYRSGILRVRAIFIHPVYLAEPMSLLAILAISAYVYLRRTNFLLLGVAALMLVGFTMMVKTILSLGFAVGFLLLHKRRWLLVPYATAAVLAIAVCGEYGIENIRNQFELYIESPYSVRREGYRIAGEILYDSPLFGTGPGSFGGFAATMLDSPIPEQYGFLNYDGQFYSSFDSHWPHLVAELGLLGFLLYGWFLWSMGRNAWRHSNRTDLSPYFRILASSAAVFLLVMIFEAFAAANLEDMFCGFLIFTILGLTQHPSKPLAK